MGTGVELSYCVILVLKMCQSEDFGLGVPSLVAQCFCVMYTHVQWIYTYFWSTHMKSWLFRSNVHILKYCFVLYDVDFKMECFCYILSHSMKQSLCLMSLYQYKDMSTSSQMCVCHRFHRKNILWNSDMENSKPHRLCWTVYALM